MAAPRANSLIQDYEGNAWLIRKLCEGLSHDESMIQPDFAANCFNWVLGHMVWRRNVALEVLDQASLWSADSAMTYKTGSPLLKPGGAVRSLAQLLEDLDQATRRIKQALEGASDDYLDEIVATDRGEKSRFEQLTGFHWHETFHVGQLDLLRALAYSRRE